MSDITKTISIQAYDRPNELKKCINHIKNLKGIYDWDVYGFVDGGPNQKVTQIMLNEATKGIIEEVRLYTDNLGIRQANIKTLDNIFEFSNFNLHCEEDVLLSEKSLEFIEKSMDYYDKNTQATTLYTYPLVNNNNDKFHKRLGLTCWGWGCSKEFYQNVLKPSFDSDKYYVDDSWASSVFEYMVDNNFYEIFPETRLSTNIGINSGYHDEGNDEERLGGVKENWAGDRFDFSLKELNPCDKVIGEDNCGVCKSIDNYR